MDKILVSLITTDKEEVIGLTSEQLIDLAELLQGDTFKGEVPMTLSIDGNVKQLTILGYIVYGKAIHNYGKIIYFGKDNLV